MEYHTISGHRPAPVLPERGRRRIVGLIVGAILFGAVYAATPTAWGPETVANAIDTHHGPGVNWGNGVHMHGAGAFVVDGKYVYCAEPWIRSGNGVPNFVGADAIPGNSSGGVSVARTEGAPLEQIAFVIARYGQTADDVQAAAVGLAVWEIRGAEGRGDSGYHQELARVRSSVGQEVTNLSQRLIAEAASWVAARASTPFTAAGPSAAVTSTGPYTGTVAVPLGTLSLRIANGVFADGSAVKTWEGAGAPPGTSLSWEGRPPAANWDKYYRVSFGGEYLRVPKSVFWGEGGNWQSSITVEAPEVTPLEIASVDLDTTWAPRVSSLVTSKFVSVGERHSDDITFFAAPEGSTASGAWRWRIGSDGHREWMPIKASVTAYGPFLTDPALTPSPEAPIGAPIAASATFRTDPARDQSMPQTYSFVFDEEIIEQGYYTYKWDIDGADQDASVLGADECLEPNAVLGCRVLPTHYFFSDGFGAANETQVGKMTQRFRTKLSTHDTPLGESFTDELTIPDMQNWLRDHQGARLPLTLTGTAYLVPGPALVQSVEVPVGAIPLTTLRVTTDPQQNGQRLTSDPVVIPVSAPRSHEHVTMRWCIVDEDQQPSARGVWEERCDDFGIPEESARIAHPHLRTEARPVGTIHDQLTDTAVVDGPVPAHSQIVFSLYKKPVPGDRKHDAANRPETHWTQDEVDELRGRPVCTTENLVTSAEAVPVAPGHQTAERYVSPGVRVDRTGEYWWVESLITRDPSTGEDVVIVTGECGLADETTTVGTPIVVTQATRHAYVGDPVRDIAVVTGPIPDPETGIRAELTFQAFRQYGDVPSCTPGNRVADLDSPVRVTAAGSYESDEVRFLEAGTYLWVETLTYVLSSGEREIVHTGACGLPQETTGVTERSVLALTGADGSLTVLAWVSLGIGGLLVSIGAALLLANRHRGKRMRERSRASVRECAG